MRNRPYMKILAVWIVLCVFAQAGELSAQTSWMPLDKTAVLSKAAQINRDRYPDAEVVLVDQHMWVKYNQDGTYAEWLEQYIKVLTEKGKRRYVTLTSSFSVPYNSTKFNLVEVISPDGTSRLVDVERNSRIMIDPSQMSANIYDPNDKVLQVSIPELNIGDTVHFITFDDFFKTRMAGQWSDFVNFEGTDPIVSSRFTVVAPRTKPLKSIALKNEIPGTVTFVKTEKGDDIIYQWTARDVPMAYLEPEMPPLYTQSQRLLASTIPDWETISRWYWNLSKPHLDAVTPEMIKTARRLVKGKRGAQEKIESIFFWVSQKVRYLGITAETEAPGYEPHPVSMTYERRAGVCRDKAALLVAMLRHAGFKAYPVLIMNGPKKDPEVPQPFFNHAVACVKMSNGSYLLMDPTNENTKELFPAYLNNQSYVVATPSGETLQTSPITPAEQNMLRIVTSGRIDKKGTLTGRTTLTFDGINDNAYRGYFSMISGDERRLYVERMLKRNLPGAVLDELSIRPANMMDTSAALQADFTFTAKHYPVYGDGIVMLPAFRFTDSIGVANFLITKMGLKERKYTYMTETACGTEEIVEIQLDGSLGKPVNPIVQDSSTDDGSSWSRSMQIADGSMKMRNLFMMKLTEYSPEKYKNLQETLKKVEMANRIMPLFAKAPSKKAAPGRNWYDAFNPDAVVLDEDITYDVQDASTCSQTVHKKIKVLTYAGRKKHSELYFTYNPVWEDVQLKKAVVISPSGQSQEINPNEVNVMDQDWVGKAPRYPAGKIKVASLPGLQEGSTIEYEYVRTKKDAWPLFISAVFQDEDPIERKSLRIRVKDGAGLKISKADSGFALDASWKPFPPGFIAETTKKEGEYTTHEYTVHQVPSITQEDLLPPSYTFMPTVMASNAGLKEYATAARNVLEKAALGSWAAQRKALALAKGLESPEQKIIALRDFVEKSIKPVNIPFSQLPLSQVTPADSTLAAGYGNSADRAVLLAALLESLGMKTQFLVTTTASPIETLQGPLSEHPSSDWLVSVLVKVVTGQGREIILGNTDQYAQLGTVATALNPAINVSKGQIEPLRPSGPELEDRGETRITIDLSATGDALLTYKRTYYGMGHASFCKDYFEMSPEERRRRFQEITSSISRSAIAVGPYKASCDTYPSRDEFSVSVPRYAIRDGNVLSLEVPSISRSIAGVNSEDRSNPLYRDAFVKGKLDIEILLPEGAQGIELRPPEAKRLALPGSSELVISTRIVPSMLGSRTGIVIQQQTDIRPCLVLPGEYPGLLEMHNALANPGMRTVVVRMEGQ